MPAVPIANGFYESRSLPFSAQRCVNWYPSYSEDPASTISEAAVYGAPGTDLLVNTGDNSNRGSHVMDGVAYFVNGTSLYRLNREFDNLQNEVFSVDNLGTIAGGGRISVADNGTQMQIIVPGVTGYIYNNQTETLVEIDDPGFTANGNAETTVFIDGYFVNTAGKKIFHSEVNDGTSYNALDVAEAQVDPDNIVATINYKNQLFVLGRETIEVFRSVPKFPFAFQRINGYVVPVGCFAAFSPIQFNQAFAFIGGSPREKAGVFWGSGQSFQRISTIPIEQKIQEASDDELSKAFTWTYSEDGAIFLGVTINEYCFVYDANASRLAGKHIWHERKSTRSTLANTQVRYRVNSMVEAYGRVLVGDAFTGNIGSLSLDTYEEYGNYIDRRLSTRPLFAMGESLFVDEVELTMESGVTTDDDNVIQLRWSDDNKTYTPYLSADIGVLGNYVLRQYWRRLGHAPRFRTFEYRYTGRDKSVLLKMEVQGDSSS